MSSGIDRAGRLHKLTLPEIRTIIFKNLHAVFGSGVTDGDLGRAPIMPTRRRPVTTANSGKEDHARETKYRRGEPVWLITFEYTRSPLR
jgi:hypothetical protein